MRHVVKIFIEFGFVQGVKLLFYQWRYRLNKSFLVNGDTHKEMSVIYSKRIKQKIYFRPYSSDVMLIFYLFVYGNAGKPEYQIDNIEDLLHEKLQDVKYIIDAGANIGLFTLLYKRLCSNAKILAVEPEKENLRLLKKNTENLEEIEIYEGGLWSANGRCDLIDRETGEWGYMLCKTKESEGSITVLDMNTLLSRFQFPYVDIVKMDIEGSEYDVFKSDNLDFIDRTKLFIIETHDRIKAGSESLVKTTLQDRGFKWIKQGENLVFYREL